MTDTDTNTVCVCLCAGLAHAYKLYNTNYQKQTSFVKKKLTIRASRVFPPCHININEYCSRMCACRPNELSSVVGVKCGVVAYRAEKLWQVRSQYDNSHAPTWISLSLSFSLSLCVSLRLSLSLGHPSRCLLIVHSVIPSTPRWQVSYSDVAAKNRSKNNGIVWLRNVK